MDKIEHLILYGVLGLILYRALFFTRGSSSNLSFVVILIVVLYGISDEIHQSFVPLRSPEVMDVVFDGLGGLVALHSGFLRRLVTRAPGEKFSFLLANDS